MSNIQAERGHVVMSYSRTTIKRLQSIRRWQLQGDAGILVRFRQSVTQVHEWRKDDILVLLSTTKALGSETLARTSPPLCYDIRTTLLQRQGDIVSTFAGPNCCR